ncbi:hypothetical protein BU23DRAFT_554281 [Bimuria novae-zelandiae CBS 107.79]|uniref:histone acetyltransferase n=1 Tax=Bimuria novae-zelandiae CBS 107.79 TaxID=1447943 RepID=A0A6A5V854_9PLEO|nr:hypothetical protein BU23DRAFT_554281 [Bimuria novae-zelandiae CBS 107.79]
MRTRRTRSSTPPSPSMAISPALTNGIAPHGAKRDLKDAEKDPTEPPTLNVHDVVLGSLILKPWFSSEGYPEEIIGKSVNRLYVCQWCFKYTTDLVPFLQHLKACPTRTSPPPGTVIYTSGTLSIYELDGADHKLYAQNLSLFAKLFLHIKSVFYDVSAFLYYLLVLDDPNPNIPNTLMGDDGPPCGQVVGFFSKEKLSWDNNNLACICVFPPWQKQGFAQVLIAASYELGRKDGRKGGPEKPLSSHGRAAYMAYWSKTLARTIIEWPEKKLTITDLHEATSITVDDIHHTLNAMGVLERKKKGHVINKRRVQAWAETNNVRLENPIDADAFVQETNDEEEEEEEEEEEDDDEEDDEEEEEE